MQMNVPRGAVDKVCAKKTRGTLACVPREVLLVRLNYFFLVAFLAAFLVAVFLAAFFVAMVSILPFCCNAVVADTECIE